MTTATTAIRFEKQGTGILSVYLFESPRGSECSVYRVAPAGSWAARGSTWYGPVFCYGSTRNEAAQKLIAKLAVTYTHA